MGSALTQSHIQNHGDLLAGAILSGTMGAFPGLDDHHMDEMHTLAMGSAAREPSPFLGELLTGFNAPFVANVPNRTGCEWQTRDVEEIRLFQTDPLCGKPFSNSMMYSVMKGFRDLWVPENERRVPVDLPILIIAGTDDPVGARTKTLQDLIARHMRWDHLVLDYRFYAGGRHEILNEPERDRVHRDVVSWLSPLDA